MTFDIDANGIVNVSAKDKASGKEQTIRIQASGGLTEADIQRMVKEAEAHADEDKRRKELVEARNQADATIYSVEKTLKEAGSRAPAALKTEIEQAVSALKEAMQRRGRAADQAGDRTAGPAGDALGRSRQPAGGGDAAGAGGAGAQSEPGVVDAEFEEVDKRDRKAS